MEPLFTSITECVDRMGQQLASDPRSKLSRTGHNWATNTTNVDGVNGIYPRTEAAQMWLHAGFLEPTYFDADYAWPDAYAADTDNCYSIWVTCRGLFGLPQP